MYSGLELEVGSSLENEYIVTRGGAKVDWYSPCVRWSLVGASARSIDGKGVWVVGWVFRRGFPGCLSVNGVKLGSHTKIFLYQ